MMPFPRTLTRIASISLLFASAGCRAYAPQAPTQQEREDARNIYDDRGETRVQFAREGKKLVLDKDGNLTVLSKPPTTTKGQAWTRDDSLLSARVAWWLQTGEQHGTYLPPWWRDAHAFCANMQRQATYASGTYAKAGWITSALGLIGTGAFVALATTDTPSAWADGSWKAFAGGGAGLSVGLTALGVYLLTRSAGADRAAAASAKGLESTDPTTAEAWNKCLDARAAWSESNAAASDAAVKDVKEGAQGLHGSAGKKDEADKKDETDKKKDGADKKDETDKKKDGSDKKGGTRE